jgi:tyrosine-specific transport protein
MNRKIGSVLLVGGCCIGAGMLGVPIMTGPGGFIPSCALFVFAFAFMVLTGLVYAEVVLSYEKDDINLLSIANDTLGKVGGSIAWGLFAFLFYAIMIAYIIGGTVLFSDFAREVMEMEVPFAVASTIFTLLMYILITRGESFVDSWNRYLMLGLVICYVMLVIYGIPYVEESRLARLDWRVSFAALPILIISFGYHNLIPTLARYLKRNKSELFQAIIYGSMIPLAVYIVWNYVILGIVPYATDGIWAQAQNKGEMVAQVLESACGNAQVVDVARGFSFFAIATSFLPVAFSFLDFLQDAFYGCKKFRGKKNLLAMLVLVPPYIAALTDHKLFLSALNYAGGISAVALFGIFPAIMAFVKKRKVAQVKKQQFVIAKTPVLVFILIISLAIMAIEIFHECGKI